VADTLDELRAEVAKWREQGNDGTGIVVNVALAEALLARPDLTPEQSREVHDRLHVKWEYASQVPGFTPEQREILAALHAAADGRIR